MKNKVSRQPQDEASQKLSRQPRVETGGVVSAASAEANRTDELLRRLREKLRRDFEAARAGRK